MEKKSVCTKCEYTGKPYTNSNGTFYYFNTEFENGDKGSVGSKEEKPPFEVGKETPYEITEEQKKDGTGTYKKIKKVQPQNKGYKKEDPKIKLRSMSISYANRFVLGDIIPRPKTEEDLNNESNENWALFQTTVQKYIKDFFSKMNASCMTYGYDNADVISVALSNAIEARLKGKIRRDMIWVYYNTLLESLLVKQEQQPQA